MWEIFKNVTAWFKGFYKVNKKHSDLNHLYRMQKNKFKKLDEEHKKFIEELGDDTRLLNYCKSLEKKDYILIASMTGQEKLYTISKELFEEFIDKVYISFYEYIAHGLTDSEKIIYDQLREISGKNSGQQRSYVISLLKELLLKGEYDKIGESAKVLDYFVDRSLNHEVLLYKCVYKLFCLNSEIEADVEDLLKNINVYTEEILLEICLYNKYLALGKKYIMDFEQKCVTKGLPLIFLEDQISVTMPAGIISSNGQSLNEYNEILLLRLAGSILCSDDVFIKSVITNLKSVNSVVFNFYYTLVINILKAYFDVIDFELLDEYLHNNVRAINLLKMEFLERLIQPLCELYYTNHKFESLENIFNESVKTNDTVIVYHYLNKESLTIDECTDCIKKMEILGMNNFIYRALYKLNDTELKQFISEHMYLLKKAPSIIDCFLSVYKDEIEIKFFNGYDSIYKDSLEYQCIKYSFLLKKGVQIDEVPQKFDLIERQAIQSNYAIALYIDYLYNINNQEELEKLLSLDVSKEQKLVIYRNLLLMDDKYFNDTFSYYQQNYNAKLNDLRIIHMYGKLLAKVRNYQEAKRVFLRLKDTHYHDLMLEELIKLKIINFEYDEDDIINECKKICSSEMFMLLGDFYYSKSDKEQAKYYYELLLLYFPKHRKQSMGMYLNCCLDRESDDTEIEKFIVGTTITLKNGKNEFLNISLHEDKFKLTDFTITDFANSTHCFQNSSIIIDNKLFLLSKENNCSINGIDYVVTNILHNEDFNQRFIFSELLNIGDAKLIITDGDMDPKEIMNRLLVEIPDSKNRQNELIELYNHYKLLLPLSYVSEMKKIPLHQLYSFFYLNSKSDFQYYDYMKKGVKNILLGYDVIILYSYVKEIEFDIDEWQIYITVKLKNLIKHELLVSKSSINTRHDNMSLYQENSEPKLFIQDDAFKRIELERISRIESLVEKCTVIDSTEPYDGVITESINSKLNEISLFEMNMIQIAKKENYAIFSDDCFIIDLSKKSFVESIGINTYLSIVADKQGLEKYIEVVKACINAGYYKIWNVSTFLILYEILIKQSDDIYSETKANILAFLNLEYIDNKNRDEVYLQIKNQYLLIFSFIYETKLLNDHTDREKWLFDFVTQIAYKHYISTIMNADTE